MSSTETTGVPDKDQYLEPIQIIQLSGFIVGMILLLYLLRNVINIIVIDVCILGDCTALKKLLCCTKRDGDGAGNGSRRLRSQDAGDLQTIGAFTDPVAYLYNDTMEEEKRTQFLDVITDTELILISKQSNTTHFEGIDPIGEDEIEENVVDNDEESNIKEHKHKSIAEEEQACCSICLQELDSDECKIRKCKHAFHKACIKSWISRSLSCPVCREDMITRDRLLGYMSSNQHLMDMEAS